MNEKAKSGGLAPDWRKHTCIDRVIPTGLNSARDTASKIATKHAKEIMKSKPPGQLDATSVIKAKMAVVVPKKWEDGKTLRCQFMDGSAIQKQKVQQNAQKWQDYANIKFSFVTDPKMRRFGYRLWQMRVPGPRSAPIASSRNIFLKTNQQSILVGLGTIPTIRNISG
jgi:hypothetical protein